MLLKKINAVIGLLSVILLWAHSAVNTLLLLRGQAGETPERFSYALFALVILHILISLFVMFFKTDHANGKKYPKVRSGWLWQRVTAVALIPLAVFHAEIHVGTFGIGLAPILAAHFLVMLLCYIHIPLSVPNALLTLGLIESSGQHKTVRTVCWAVCALLFAFGLAAGL